MSSSIDPASIPLNMSSIKRWTRCWIELTRRELSTLVLLSVAGEFAPALLSHVYGGPFAGGLALDFSVSIIGFAVGIVVYAKSDSSMSTAHGLHLLMRGLGPWLMLAIAWCIGVAFAGLAGQWLLSALSPVADSLAGATAHNADTTGPVLDDALSIAAAQYFFMVSGRYCVLLLLWAPIFVAAFVIFCLQAPALTALRLTWLFVQRNMAISGALISAPLILGMADLGCTAAPLYGLAFLPAAIFTPAIIAGATYVVARESFLGRRNNYPAKVSRACSRASAPG